MTTTYLPWYMERGHGPLLATAIHDGHALREGLEEDMAISNAEWLREEDPFTGEWTRVAPNRVIGLQSRFEFDLNRPRDKAVYRVPEDAWGLKVWERPPADGVVGKSVAVYDAFYAEMKTLLDSMVERYGRVVVLDLHSYNHRRDGVEASPADPFQNPDVNLGTGTMARDRWSSVVDRFIVDLRNFNFFGRSLDVRENVKFRGGHFPEWIHERFPTTVCVLSVEFKKFFMDEWSGEGDQAQIDAVERALRSTIWGIYEELTRLNFAARGVSA